MKTITITFNVTDREYGLLKLGKCDAPHPQHMKMLLLTEAYRNVRHEHEAIMQAARAENSIEPVPAKLIGTLKVPI